MQLGINRIIINTLGQQGSNKKLGLNKNTFTISLEDPGLSESGSFPCHLLVL
jgi:hypothetical protein